MIFILLNISIDKMKMMMLFIIHFVIKRRKKIYNKFDEKLLVNIIYHFNKYKNKKQNKQPYKKYLIDLLNRILT